MNSSMFYNYITLHLDSHKKKTKYISTRITSILKLPTQNSNLHFKMLQPETISIIRIYYTIRIWTFW